MIETVDGFVHTRVPMTSIFSVFSVEFAGCAPSRDRFRGKVLFVETRLESGQNWSISSLDSMTETECKLNFNPETLKTGRNVQSFAKRAKFCNFFKWQDNSRHKNYQRG